MEARVIWDHEAAGSIPAYPTKIAAHVLGHGSYENRLWQPEETALIRKIRLAAMAAVQKTDMRPSMVLRGFESSIFRHYHEPEQAWANNRDERFPYPPAWFPACSLYRTVLHAGITIRSSKHNRYCGGLLIRSPVDSGVQVQVLPAPPRAFSFCVSSQRRRYGSNENRVPCVPKVREENEYKGTSGNHHAGFSAVLQSVPGGIQDQLPGIRKERRYGCRSEKRNKFLKTERSGEAE